MTRVTVLIDVIAGGERQRNYCFDALADVDRRKNRDRRDPDRHHRWQQESTPGQSAEARAYRFRSLADRRAKQERQATAWPDTSFHTSFHPQGGGTIGDDPGYGISFSKISPRPDREEILIRVSDDRSGSSVRWLHVEL